MSHNTLFSICSDDEVSSTNLLHFLSSPEGLVPHVHSHYPYPFPEEWFRARSQHMIDSFFFSYILVICISIDKCSHVATPLLKIFPLTSIHATHAALNLAPITHNHPIGSLTLSQGFTWTCCIP